MSTRYVKIGLSDGDKINMKTEIRDSVMGDLSPIIDTRLDNQDTKIENIVSGSPKGVYASLSALQSALPSGDTGIYVCLDNGHWYYWNGSAWTDGGVYQAVEIGENSIDLTKINDTELKPNFILNNYITNDKQVMPSTSWKYTIIILPKIKKIKKLSCLFACLGDSVASSFFEDKNGKYLKRISNNGSGYVEVDVPSNAYKLYLSNRIADTSGIIGVANPILNIIEYANYEIKDNSIDYIKTDFLQTEKNKYNCYSLGIEEGVYYSYLNGSKETDSNYISSDFTLVKEKTKYIVTSITAHITFWNNDKKFIGGFLANSTNGYIFTTPNDCRYVRSSFGYNERYQYMIVEGETLGSNEKYKLVLNDKIVTKKENNVSGFRFPYIHDQRVVTNKIKEERTASYITIDLGEKPTELSCKFIFDNNVINVSNKSGTMALITNPNGDFTINNITSSSLHLDMTNNFVHLRVLGEKYGHYTYCDLVNTTLSNNIPMDGETEVSVKMTINENNVMLNISFNDTNYTFESTFVDNYGNGFALSDFVGQYCTLEHFVDGDMNNYNMPQFTEFKVKGSTKPVMYDDFKDKDGVLKVSPTGHIYHLFTNELNDEAYNN